MASAADNIRIDPKSWNGVIDSFNKKNERKSATTGSINVRIATVSAFNLFTALK